MPKSYRFGRDGMMLDFSNCVPRSALENLISPFFFFRFYHFFTPDFPIGFRLIRLAIDFTGAFWTRSGDSRQQARTVAADSKAFSESRFAIQNDL